MKTIRITGVPEHFNMPWHMALEEGAFADRGMNLEWTDTPEGTGKMIDKLKSGGTDLAIILTEGVVKGISDGLQAKIVQEYIASPLLWGVHVDARSSFSTVEDLENSRAAISRYGSGSHLMAFVQARQEGWNLDKLQFVVVDNLEGAVNALGKGQADYFMWEHFTTKPLVDGGTFRRLGDFPTPWPCFVIAAADEFLKESTHTLRHILEVINSYTWEFRQIPSIDRTLANRYGQQLEDIREWLSLTRWSQRQIKSQTVENVSNTLYKLKLISKELPASAFLSASI